jgi:fatty acid-binding protein DegV
MNIRIVTDSTCDLPDEIVSQQAITVVPLYINAGEESYLDGVTLTRDEFYNAG